MSEAVEKLVKQGFAKGQTEGEYKTKIATAQRLILMDKFSDEEISEISTLPLSKVQELREDMLTTA